MASRYTLSLHWRYSYVISFVIRNIRYYFTVLGHEDVMQVNMHITRLHQHGLSTYIRALQWIIFANSFISCVAKLSNGGTCPQYGISMQHVQSLSIWFEIIKHHFSNNKYDLKTEKYLMYELYLSYSCCTMFFSRVLCNMGPRLATNEVVSHF